MSEPSEEFVNPEDINPDDFEGIPEAEPTPEDLAEVEAALAEQDLAEWHAMLGVQTPEERDAAAERDQP